MSVDREVTREVVNEALTAQRAVSPETLIQIAHQSTHGFNQRILNRIVYWSNDASFGR
jgi:hypothetical protein